MRSSQAVNTTLCEVLKIPSAIPPTHLKELSFFITYMYLPPHPGFCITVVQHSCMFYTQRVNIDSYVAHDHMLFPVTCYKTCLRPN